MAFFQRELDPPPVFVGGVGRSGTTACTRMLGHHSRYFMPRVELDFHTRGFPVLLKTGNLSRFLKRMRGDWYSRQIPNGPVSGLIKLIERDALEEALLPFASHFQRDPVAACRVFMTGILMPAVRAAGKQTWIEMSPPNIEHAGTLSTIFPEARFIHMKRDGRDIACSVGIMPWAPKTLAGRLDWWAERLRVSEAGAASLPSDRLLTVHLEDLVRDSRDESYHRLLAFLDLSDEPDLRDFFDTRVVAERANLGRWRDEEGNSSEFLDHYERLIKRADRAESCLP